MNTSSYIYTKTNRSFQSIHLNRTIEYDIYSPSTLFYEPPQIILINDGQDLEKMQFAGILNQLNVSDVSIPLICIGIHASADRKNEYGTARALDYMGRGATANDYQQFILLELLPLLRVSFNLSEKYKFGYLGFSLGGLSAIDTVWHHANYFNVVGVFSGAFWWRDKDQNDPNFDENKHRIMHRLIREGIYNPDLRFFFEAGSMDETADRNNNGIIDAIDDTLGLIRELKEIGYLDSAIQYIELSEGRHDIDTWKKVMPIFLDWARKE